ncbi:hypothetical protein [Nostoc sp.]|uniref:hypothetical protein n=1 Tax=Nostoc sp. TaxID=1180 RepID=UPI002FF4A804
MFWCESRTYLSLQTISFAYVISIKEFSQNCITKYSFSDNNQVCKYPSLSDRKTFRSTDFYTPSFLLPVTMCLSRTDRELLAGDVGKGGRNTSSAKFARNFIGTALRLQYLGIHHSASPRQLFETYCDQSKLLRKICSDSCCIESIWDLFVRQSFEHQSDKTQIEFCRGMVERSLKVFN